MKPDLSWLLGRPVAHRGLHDAAAGVPENSLAAFAAAARLGLPMELDVRLTADGVPVVFHDASFVRMTGAAGLVAATPLAGLQALRLLGTGERIPTLAEALALVGGRSGVLIELKEGGPVGPLEVAVLAVIRSYSGPVAALSFSPAILAWFRRHAPDIPRCQNAARYDRDGHGLTASTRFIRRHLLSVAISRPAMVAYQIDAIGDFAPDVWRRHGGVLLAWTARSSAAYEAARVRCDAVIFEGFPPPV